MGLRDLGTVLKSLLIKFKHKNRYIRIKTKVAVILNIKEQGGLGMKKSTIVIIVVVVILVAIIAGLVSNYNGVVSLSEEVDNKFATIDTMLQRRADLIPK